MAPTASPGSGALVAIEGIDGSGKSTVARRLSEHLRRREQLVFETREPTDSYVGTAVREAVSDPEHDPVSEALLFAADHAGHVATIHEALADGAVVISDRYSVSWRVYQSITLADAEAFEGEPAAWLDAVLEPFELVPDRVIVLDLPVEHALERVEGRARAGEKFEDEAFLKRVRGRYLELAREHGWARVDANRPPEAVFDDCLDEIEELVGGSA